MSSEQNFFVSGRYRVQISVRRPAVLMFICCRFVQTSVWIVRKRRPRSLANRISFFADTTHSKLFKSTLKF